MKTHILKWGVILIACSGMARGQAGGTFTNFIRQVQMPSGVQWDASVAPKGQQVSLLPIDMGGSRFELWTLLSSPLTSYLLDTRYVSAYLPAADVAIRSEDPYSVIPRTRADRPFYVDLTVSGMLSGITDPDASKSAKLLRHVQSYGVGGNGQNIDRTQATLFSQASLTQNGTQTLTYTLTSVPGTDRSKVRGEERFSVFSLADGLAPESQIASKFIQIWPVADGAISGLVQNQVLRTSVPDLTLAVNDLYPASKTYALVYRGGPSLGVTGTIVPGSALVLNETIPQSRVLSLKGYDAVFDGDGLWTMELLTATPFGIDRLAYVTFTIKRTININSMVSTME